METCEGHDEFWLKIVQFAVTIAAGVIVVVFVAAHVKKLSSHLRPCLKGAAQ